MPEKPQAADHRGAPRPRGLVSLRVRVPIYVGDRPTMGTNLWVELLPYFEQDNLYKKWDYNDNRNNVAGGSNATTAQVIKILLCPSDPLPELVVQFAAAGAPLLGPGASMG
jgi:Protein of unknown function (DUF1559)